MLAAWKKIYDQPRQHIKKQRQYFANKGPSSKAMFFPVVVYGCESWTIKKAECQKIDAFKLWCWRRLESFLDCKEIQPVHPKGNQSWIFIGKTNVEAETPILLATWCEGLTHLKRSWCWEWLKVVEGDDRGWDGWVASPTQWTWVWITLGAGDGQEGLVCCSLWGHKQSDTIEWLNWTELMGLDAMMLVFLMLSFKPAFSLSWFTFIKRLFSFSVSAIRVCIISAYLRLLIFLPPMLIPACASSSPVFHMMYSAYKLNKQGNNIQPWCTPFLIWNQSVSCTIHSSNKAKK